MLSTPINTNDNLLTEAELFAGYLGMTVVTSSNLGEATSHIPGDFFCPGECWVSRDFAITARSRLLELEDPKVALELLVEDLNALLTTSRRVASEFGEFMRHSEVRTVPKPDAEDSDEMWEAYNEGVRYRAP